MKVIGENLYVHKSNLAELERVLDREQKQLMAHAINTAFREEIPYEIVKFNLDTNSVTLINAIEWAERYEPIVGDSVAFWIDGTRTKRKGGFQVYHKKELMVNPEYVRFDMEEAKRRTELLDAFPEVKKNKSRIGSLKWWNEFLEKNHLPVYMKGVSKYI